MKLLLLPFLNMPSGHHQAADAIASAAKSLDAGIHCRKVDIFHHGYEKLEKWTSHLYLQWIRYFPKSYSSLYSIFLYNGQFSRKHFQTYEDLFLEHTYKLLRDELPDFVICTHSIPSYLVSRLKQLGCIHTRAINVYTDFFINDAWSTGRIDHHFVPNLNMKHQLAESGVDPEQIYVTGIPVHPAFVPTMRKNQVKDRWNVLIAAGSSGSGNIRAFVERLNPSGQITYKVLCGENKGVYEYLKRKKHPFLIPLPYISSREAMNALYDEADAIVTKPGGVTVSECLAKELPMIIFGALPGQEEINLRFLKQKGLVYHLETWRRGLDQQLIALLCREDVLSRWKDNMRKYRIEAADSDLAETLSSVLQLEASAGKRRPAQ